MKMSKFSAKFAPPWQTHGRTNSMQKILLSFEAELTEWLLSSSLPVVVLVRWKLSSIPSSDWTTLGRRLCLLLLSVIREPAEESGSDVSFLNLLPFPSSISPNVLLESADTEVLWLLRGECGEASAEEVVDGSITSFKGTRRIGDCPPVVPVLSVSPTTARGIRESLLGHIGNC